MTRMLLVVGLAVGLAAAPAHARKAKRHNTRRPDAATKVTKDQPDRAVMPPRVDNQAEFDKAKAELDDLKSSRDIPLVSLSNQDGDREVPGSKVK